MKTLELHYPMMQFLINKVILSYPTLPINVKPEGGGRGGRHRVGILTFCKKKYQNPHRGQKIIVKISRNKWFTSLLLFEIERSNAWCSIKIPTLGIYVTVKFP